MWAGRCGLRPPVGAFPAEDTVMARAASQPQDPAGLGATVPFYPPYETELRSYLFYRYGAHLSANINA